MKKIILLSSFALFSLVVAAQSSNIEENSPVIKFETETIKYGTIIQGSNGVREFHFTNTGKTALFISETKQSCGCTIPTSPKEPIKPGDKSVIKVKYDTKRLGAFSKTVTVISNAKRSAIILKIEGNVIAKESLEDLKSNSPIN